MNLSPLHCSSEVFHILKKCVIHVFGFELTYSLFFNLFYLTPPHLHPSSSSSSHAFLCRAFTVTAIAQMCILGLMWVFGAFLFQEGAIVAAYIFTILNSLQGALVFIMHCLLSKQVGLLGVCVQLRLFALCHILWNVPDVVLPPAGER